MNRVAAALRLVSVLAVAAAAGCSRLDLRDYPATHPANASHVPVDVDGTGPASPHPPETDLVARELEMVSWPKYRISPPDSLFITAVRAVPKPPYQLQPLDIVFIAAAGVLQGEDIGGPYQVGLDGSIILGGSYGGVRVQGLTLQEAKAAIEKRLSFTVTEASVMIALFEVAGTQQIDGEHLVAMDGSITLGQYGRVVVAGMTIPEAKAAIEKKLSERLINPEVSVEVQSFNSSFYYVVLQGPGIGDQSIPFPATGRETVLDAMAALGTIPRISSKNIWIARPAPDGSYRQILPVAWNDIYRHGMTDTNYQIFPNDRVYVANDQFVAIDSFIAKVSAPFERMFGFSLLGIQSVQTVNRFPSGFRSGEFNF